MIVLLTYDRPHRKTQDVAWALLRNGYEFCVVATPWEERKPRPYIYPHRPGERNWPCEPFSDEMWTHLGIPYHRTETQNLPDTLKEHDPEYVVVGGAGILPRDIVTEFFVINVHPGLLPARRGLDVLKWAVRDLKAVGVTAHRVDEHTDLGWLIKSEVVPVYHSDTFHAFAMRQYEMEIDLLVTAVSFLKHGFQPTKIDPGETRAFRRMPTAKEVTLMDDFDKYKLLFAK